MLAEECERGTRDRLARDLGRVLPEAESDTSD